MPAVHDADQLLTSLEFEAGMGDYGEDLSRQVPPTALALKTRLCVAQGNRLVNYYLFAGGCNPPLSSPVGDGNSRIAFTWERHGFAAPVDPEGNPSPGYPVLAETVAAVRGAARGHGRGVRRPHARLRPRPLPHGVLPPRRRRTT